MLFVSCKRHSAKPPLMPLRTAVHILLGLAIVLIATVGGAHGSARVDREVVTAVPTSAPRIVEGRCSSSGQTHCPLLALMEDRAIWTRGEEVSAARLSASNEPHRSGSDPHLEEKPPRSR